MHLPLCGEIRALLWQGRNRNKGPDSQPRGNRTHKKMSQEYSSTIEGQQLQNGSKRGAVKLRL